MNVQVKAPTAAAVNVAVTVETEEGTDFAGGEGCGGGRCWRSSSAGSCWAEAVTLAELGSRIYALPGVENCHITAPAADRGGR